MFDAPEPPHRPGSAAGSYQDAGQYGTLQEIPFTDGAWRAVTVLAKMRDQAGAGRCWCGGS